MVNTMEDLKREVASRLRNSLHGKEVDMIESVKPRLPHMLGITPLNKVHDPNNEEMTLLDTAHPFWNEWAGSIETKSEASDNIQTAIRLLKEEDTFRMMHPYGEEADIIYCEVDEIDSSGNDIQTSCAECGADVTTQPNLSEDNGFYGLCFTIDCPKCDFSGSYKQTLMRE